MSTYPVDIKAKQITSTAANQEEIPLEDNGSALAVFGTPDGSSAPFVYNATFPGTGIKASTKLTVTLATIADVTFYFG